jgi:3',5'-cyclic AMP phosphodiesterase CpdA
MPKRKTKRAIVLPDIHVPLQSKQALECVYQAMEIVKPDTLILLGDVAELESVSMWQWKKKKRPTLEDQLRLVNRDLRAANRVLDDIDRACDKSGVKQKYYCEGNHEVWLDNFIEENPFLEKEYSVKNAFRLNKRGYHYYPYGKYLKLGDLNFYHGGHYRGMYHAINHVRQLASNVMYAHHHDVAREGLASMRGVHAAWCIGSLKQYNSEANKWLKGRKVNWSLAFAIVDWFNGGKFKAEVVDITAGKTMVWGKLIDGNKRR